MLQHFKNTSNCLIFFILRKITGVDSFCLTPPSSIVHLDKELVAEVFMQIPKCINVEEKFLIRGGLQTAISLSTDRRLKIAPTPADSLLTEHWGLATAVARDYRNIPGVAFDDVLQHARIALTRAANTFRSDLATAFSTYAWRVIHNDLNSLYSRQKKRYCLEVASEEDVMKSEDGKPTHLEAADETADVLREVDRREIVAALRKSVSHLPPKLKKVISGILKGDDYRCIGQEMGFSDISSKTLVSRAFHEALRQLRADLERQGFSCRTHGLRSVHLVSHVRMALTSPE